MLRGLVVTGGVITSAGVVLAATFSALAVLPLVVLVELGVAVAVGVLLDTTVVRSLLVPALAHDIGRRSGGRVSWPAATRRTPLRGRPMGTRPTDADVVIVGGGLAGLAAARRLDRAGLDWVLVEAADRLGGRVATDVRRRLPARPRLPGAQHRLPAAVRAGRPRRPRPVPVHARRAGPARPDLVRLAASLRPGVLGASLGAAARLGARLDLVRFAALVARYASLPPARLLDAPETTAEAALRQAGLSHAFIEELARPFLSGVFADRSLETSSHVLAMIVRSFARGRIAVPAAGMAALPAAVAAPLPRRPAAPVDPGRRVAPGAVSLVDGPVVRCRAVLVAAATNLLPAVPMPRMHALTTYYHAAAEPPLTEPTLLLDGDRREIVANTVVVSAGRAGLRPARAITDRHLGGRPGRAARAGGPRRAGPPLRRPVDGLGPPAHGATPGRAAGRATAAGPLRAPVASATASSSPVTTATARPSRARWPAAGAPPARWSARLRADPGARRGGRPIGRSG